MRGRLAVAALALAACSGSPPPPRQLPPPGPQGPLPDAAPPADVATRPPAVADTSRLRAYAATRGFRLGAPQAMVPTSDGQAVLFLRSGPRDPRQSLFEANLKTGETREVLSPDKLLAGPEKLSAAERARRERLRTRATGFTELELSEDGSRVLLSLSGHAYVLERKTGETRELPTGGAGTDLGAVIDPHLSHDGRRVAYVRGHDLYVLDVERSGRSGGSAAEVALTKGGTETLSHGSTEFIAAEELGRSRGFWWSPDDTRVVYEEADTAGVEVLHIADPAHPEREPVATRYPRAGGANAKVRLGIVGVSGGRTTWVALDQTRFPYIATVTWDRGAPLVLYALDRPQRVGMLLAVDSATGKTKPLVVENDSAWLDVDPTVPRWLPDGSAFLWSSERDGNERLELRDSRGGLLRVLTDAAIGYRGLLDVDGRSRVAYVRASAEPADAGIFRVPLDGSAPDALVAPDGRNATATFSTTHDVLAVQSATRAAMPEYWAQTVERGAPRHPIAALTEAPAALPNVELTTIGPDAVRVAIVRPTSFAPGKRYPVIDSAYAGPGHSVAISSALRFVLDQWIADRADAIVVAIDAKGTPDRGRAWERAIAGNLGSVPLSGHVAALAALGARFPEMDTSRVGVYGWSFGGYFAAMAALARPDVYQVAVAAAPPADWRDYDTCYTERYLGLPESSASAYDAASLLTMAASSLEGPRRPLLVVHGTADDNVYFFHSLKLAGALEKAGRPFELFPVPDMTHVPRDPDNLEAIFRTAADFLGRHLEHTAAPARR